MLLVVAAASVLAYGDAGIQVGDANVFSGKVDAAVYDPAQDLIWFRSEGLLEVADLRTTPPTVTVIAKKVPSEGAFAITGVSQAGFLVGDWAIAYPRFAIGKTAKVTVVKGLNPGDNHQGEDDARHAVKKIKIVVGKKWLAAFARRAPHAVPSTAPTVEQGMDGWCKQHSDGQDGCGNAWPIGSAGYEIVQTGIDGEAGVPIAMCAVWSPRDKAFAALDGTTDWKDNDPAMGTCDAIAEPGGERYAYGQWICTPGKKGVACEESQTLVYFGWVPGAAPSDVISQLSALSDQACACSDDACKQTVLAKVRQLAQDHANDTGTADQAKQVNDLATKISACTGVK